MIGGVVVGARFERDGVEYVVTSVRGGAPGFVVLSPVVPLEVAAPDLVVAVPVLVAEYRRVG